MNYIINSIFDSITYILPVGSQKDCWLVDCGDIDKIYEQGWYVRGVLLTHAHFDHIYGLNRLMELSPNALVYTNAEGATGLQNPKWNFSRYHEEVENFVFCKPENVHVLDSECLLNVDCMSVEVFLTPGHEPSCVCYRVDEYLFTGDSYIPGVNVIKTFPRSDKKQATESLVRLQELERSGMKIMPGHWIETSKTKDIWQKHTYSPVREPNL